MTDPRLAAEEARRVDQHAEVKSEVERDVDAEVTARAAATTADRGRVAEVADEFRHHAVDEVVQTERELGRGRSLARVSQVVDYIFGIVYAMLALRFVLALIAANSSAGFVRFVRAVTDPLYAPFRSIVPSEQAPGGYTFAWPLLLAIGVYILLHLGIKGLLRVVGVRRTSI